MQIIYLITPAFLMQYFFVEPRHLIFIKYSKRLLLHAILKLHLEKHKINPYSFYLRVYENATELYV